jgi:cytochrome b
MDTTVTLPAELQGHPQDALDTPARPGLRPGREAPARVPAPALAPPPSRIRLWDLPTRLFHWLLVAAVTVAVGTGWAGGDWMAVHGVAGVSIVGLVSFRVVWGFVGSTHSRFARFAPTPAKVWAYLRGRWKGVGHNPLGAISVFLLLGLLAVQAVTGLFGNDDIAFSGPLAGRVDESLSRWMTGIHHQVADASLVFLGLHVLAIVFYTVVKKDKLVGPMVTGHKVTDEGESTRGGGWLALATALSAAAIAVAVATGAIEVPLPAVGGSASTEEVEAVAPSLAARPQQDRVAPEAPPAW